MEREARGDGGGILGGVGILLIQLCAIVPGLLPCLLLGAVFVVPLLALAAVAGVAGGLLAALWWLARRGSALIATRQAAGARSAAG